MKLIHKNSKQLEGLEKTVEELKKSPVYEAFQAEKQAKTVEQREQAASRIEALREQLTAAVASAELAQLVEKMTQAEARRRKAEVELQKARVQMLNTKASLEAAIRRETAVLYSSYDGAIDEAIDFFQEQLTELRTDGKTSTQRVGSERNLFTEKKKVHLRDNHGAVLNAISYCQRAVRTLETMKLAPQCDHEGIQTLKENIPSIDVYHEYEGEKAFLPGGPTPQHQGRADGLMKKLGIR